VLRSDVILAADLITSIGVELVVMPLLSLWLVLVIRACLRAQRFAAVCE